MSWSTSETSFSEYVKYDSCSEVKGKCEHGDCERYLCIPEMCGNVVREVAELESKNLMHGIRSIWACTIH